VKKQGSTTGGAMAEIKVKLAYPSLEDATTQFRMLSLRPSPEFDADIRCHVHNRSQHRRPTFEALSYRWGAAEDTKIIHVRVTAYQGLEESEDTPYVPWPVTRNLEEALRALRLPDRDRLLWVDALCINQSNTIERGQQVRLMALIYRACVRDLLWLGPENESVRRAMELIPRLQGHEESGHRDVCLAPEANDEITFSAFSEQDWDDFKSLVSRPDVWNRVWIIQELILSPEILLVCGKATLDWKCIDSVLDDNLEIRRQVDFPGPVSTNIHKTTVEISTIRTHRMPQDITARFFDKSLLSTFFWFLSWQATDRRDKVYAILNLTTEGKSLDISYEKDMDQLSIDFAKACLAQGDLKILSHGTSYCVEKQIYLKKHAGPPGTYDGQTGPAAKRRAGWPTWLPDLSDDIIDAAKISGLSIAGLCKYNACGPMSKGEYTVTQSLQLVVVGIYVDTISHVNQVSLVSESETERERWIRDVNAWAPPEARQENAILKAYPWSSSQGESVVTAYWRTIVTDRRADKRLTPEELNHVNTYMEISEGREVPEELMTLTGWRFGKTTSDMYCMLPPQTRIGDVLCVLNGGQVPLLLRPKLGVEEKFELVGEAYVHGLMDGSAMLRAFENMHKMMQADPNHDFAHMQEKIKNEGANKQFLLKRFTIL
jgi:hypothetical protein